MHRRRIDERTGGSGGFDFCQASDKGDHKTEKTGKGGGRGEYSQVEGDLPLSIFCNLNAGGSGHTGSLLCTKTANDGISFGRQDNVCEDVKQTSSNARGGGGTGAYRHVDGDFHSLHCSPGEDCQIGRAVTTLAGHSHAHSGNPHNDYSCLGVNGRGGGTMVVISWNCCGLQAGAVNDVVSVLNNWGRWDIVLVQEGPANDQMSHEVLEGGHVWFVAPKLERQRSPTILMHKRWTSQECKPEFHSVTGRIAYSDLTVGEQMVRFCTVHMPHSDFSRTDFEANLEAAETILEEARRCRRMNVAGFDANAVVGGQKDWDCCEIVGQHGVGQRNDRGCLFVDWLHGSRMAALGTMFRKHAHDLLTHTLWSTGEKRQIDYLLIDSIARGQVTNVGIIQDLEGTSDHLPTFARFKLCPRVRKKKTKSHIGWKAKLDENDEPTMFQSELEVALRECDKRDIEELTRTIVESASKHAMRDTTAKKPRHSAEVQSLFAERRAESFRDRRKYLSKQLWRALRKERRFREEEALRSIAERGGGARQLGQLSGESRKRVTAAVDANGVTHTTVEGIGEVFRAFYEQLYEADCGESAKHFLCLQAEGNVIVTMEEVRAALKDMKGNKTAAEDGLVAEMLKAGGQSLIETLADVFTELLCDRLEMPGTWRKSRLTVLFKTGDRQMPKNYRPITIIPVLSKLYSMILLRKIYVLIDGGQIDTQFGKRKGRGCSDAVHILRQVVEKSIEWKEGLWMAAVDVEKAFDRVHHRRLLQALMDEGVQSEVVRSLRSLYMDLSGYVQLWPGACSTEFGIGRGVRQGDPLSPLLFGLVMKHVLKDLDGSWQAKGFGTNIGQDLSGRRLTHVAFVDDVTLVAKNFSMLKAMMTDLKDRLMQWGLKVHPTKCKAQTTNDEWSCRGVLSISEGFAVEVLSPGVGLTILGTQLVMETGTSKEIASRISKGWKMFFAMKRIFCNQAISRKKAVELV